jgi:hypothetical protein
MAPGNRMGRHRTTPALHVLSEIRGGDRNS